jgi:catechol 2,3-dioxygenase-like lactoylglutathione lyase family enzyme
MVGMTTVSRHWSAVINCADIDRMTEFWSAVLGLERHPASGDTFRVLRGKHGNVALQLADDPVTYRDQVHFDVYVPAAERDDEVARIIGLGATHVRDSDEPEDPFVVLADPEGNYLCVCPVDAAPSA